MSRQVPPVGARSEKREAPVVDGSSAVCFGAPNFRVLDLVDDGHEVTISLESAVTMTGCSSCGTQAKAKDRR